MENIEIGSSSPLVGLTMEVARRDVGITVLAMRKGDKQLIANPPDSETIEAGDRLIVIGTKKRLARLESTFEGGKS